MSLGKNPGGYSRLPAKAFDGSPAKIIPKILNKINCFSQKGRVYEQK